MLLSFDYCLPFCRRFRSRRRPRGFTLLELLVVIGIVASLGAIMLGLGRRAVETGHIARTQTELAALSTALEEYRRVCGDYPRTDAAVQLLQSLIGRRGPTGEVISIHGFIETGKLSAENAADPFIDSAAVLVDPWGKRYVYFYKTQLPWANASYVLYSIGPDGRDSATLLNGGFVNPAAVENADNLYANQLR